MSVEQLIPNAVGRLDDVVEAIKHGEGNLAWVLLQDEYERRHEKTILLRKELDREMEALYEVGRIRDIADSMSTGGSRLLGNEWDQLRRECGWNDRDDVAVSSRIEST